MVGTRLSKGDHARVVAVALVAGMVGASAPAIAHGVKHALFAHEAGTAEKAGNSTKLGGRTFPQVFAQTTTANLDLNSDLSDGSLSPGDTATQEITIENQGPADALGVVMMTSRTGWTGSEESAACDFEAGTVRCVYQKLPAGASRSVEIEWSPQPNDCNGYGVPFDMTPRVFAWQFDPDTSNNEESHATDCPN